MDAAYDQIQGQAFADNDRKDKENKNEDPKPASDFNTDVQQAYQAISSSPWAARLGGFFGTVKKQGEQYYEGARQEYTNASSQATKGLSSIIGRTRGLSVQQQSEGEVEGGPSQAKGTEAETHPDRPESLPADIVKEAEGILSRFRAEAAKRLKDIEKAEDAADEALLKFGSNIGNFLREAVTIAPPDASAGDNETSKVLFESKDAEGRRVIHTTRLEAQLHVIHSSLDSFLRNPDSPEWEPWAGKFDVNAHTGTISKDLEEYEDLRRAMEKLVPERVEYSEFWKRYYFLRYVVESEDKKRKEMLKASANNATDDEIAWDEDSDEDETTTPNTTQPLAASKETLKPADQTQDLLKPEEPRRSGDQHSQPDSDASYDLVSGATSRAQGSPKEAKKDAVAEESDEDDWE